MRLFRPLAFSVFSLANVRLRSDINVRDDEANELVKHLVNLAHLRHRFLGQRIPARETNALSSLT
jgi:hypothetical protein